MEPSQFISSSSTDREMIEDLTCVLCHKVMLKPRRCPEEHAFCYPCIMEYLKTHDTCPGGPHNLSKDDVCPNKFALRMVNRLSVMCGYHGNGKNASPFTIRKRLLKQQSGCRWVGPCRDLDSHMGTCGWRYVTCQQCGRKDIPHIFMAAHRRYCVGEMRTCELCGHKTTNLQKHIEQDCQQANVYCPNHCTVGDGPQVRLIKRANLKHHLTQCQKRLVQCPFACGWKGWISSLPQHEMQAMPLHLKALTAQLNGAKSEIEALKTRLKRVENRKEAIVIREDDEGGRRRKINHTIQIDHQQDGQVPETGSLQF